MKKFIKEEPTLTVLSNGTKYWRIKNKSFHRENGPAVEFPSSDKSWYFKGKCMFDFENKKICFLHKNYNKPEVQFIFNNIYFYNKETKQ